MSAYAEAASSHAALCNLAATSSVTTAGRLRQHAANSLRMNEIIFVVDGGWW